MKTALVLSGGGAKGAFQLGALEELKRRQYSYDLVAGVSVGSLNGVMVAAERLKRLGEIWRTITPDKVFRKRSLGELVRGYLLHAIGVKKPPLGIYSNDPLRKLMEKELKNIELSIPFTAGRVDLVTGNYLSGVSPKSISFVEAILASSAIPVIWDPVKIGGAYLVDGGIRNITPVEDALKRNPDRMIVITTEPRDKPPSEKKINDIVDIAERTLSILLDEIFNEDLRHCMQMNKWLREAQGQGITLTDAEGKPVEPCDMILIEPEETLGSALSFERERLNVLIEKGKEAAVKAISPPV